MSAIASVSGRRRSSNSAKISLHGRSGSRIAQHERVILERPGLAADRLQMSGGIFEEVRSKAWHERDRVGESAFEERVNGLGRRQRLEAFLPLIR
jgi:hypothetical protein